MAIVTGLTKDRMLEIEASSIVNGYIEPNGHLILEQHDGTLIDAGPVAGTNVIGITDNETLDLALTGFGTSANPWNLQGTVKGFAMREVTDWNLATNPGFYWGIDPLNAPSSGTGYWWVGFVYKHESGGRITQEIRRSMSTAVQNKFVRYYTGTAWTEWMLDGGQGQGSAAARDLLFGTPTTDAEKVALANRKIRWYNTDMDWEESYYAPTGLAGLTAKGLVAGTAAGWYPTGEGPFVILEPTTLFVASSGSYVGNWHNGNMRRKGGATWFVPASNGFTEILKAGRYDIMVSTQLENGTGTANFHLKVLNNALTTTMKWVDGVLFDLYSTWANRLHAELIDVHIAAGEKAALYCHSGALDVHFLDRNPRGQFVIRYKGPALVSD